MAKEKKAKVTYEQIVEECRRLRARHEQAEAEFFPYLMVVEIQHKNVWQEAGCVIFAQFLKSNHLCKPDRYRFFTIGVERTSPEEAMLHGAPWTIRIGMEHRPTAEFISRMSHRASAFRDTEGVSPSVEAVREWSKELRDPDPTDRHRTIRKVDELSRLQEENKRLRAELKAAKKRIVELEQALEPVDKKATKKKKAA